MERTIGGMTGERTGERVRLRILVTDDNAKLRALLRRALERDGYAVVEAGTAAELWAALAVSKPDLIVLDALLPDSSGWGLLESLKAGAATASIPVLIWSGQHLKSDRPLLLQLGAEDYVDKGPPSAVMPTIKQALLRTRRG